MVGALAGCATPVQLRTADGKPDPKKAYELYCMGCHGPDGRRGEEPMQLTGAGKRPLAELTHVISDGRNGMPAWKARLKPDEIEALARYVQNLTR